LLAFATATLCTLSSAASIGPRALHNLKIHDRVVAAAGVHTRPVGTVHAVLAAEVTSVTRHRNPARAAERRRLDRLLRAGVALGPIVATAVAARPKPRELGGVWQSLRVCESGNDYAKDTGNGYYGAYQFSLPSWWAVGYSGLPSQASANVQDAAAERLLSRSGWRAWPACSVELGLR